MHTGEKRKWRRDDDDEGSKEEKPETKPAVKYIGETSRSAFERYKEHLEDFRNIRVKSHILKHYPESHRDIDLDDLEVKMKILKKYRTSFERQIGESIWINHNLKLGTHLLNSKNEYNRCSIPILGLIITKEDMVDEYRENQRENEMKREISKLKEEIRRETKNEMNKSKRRKLSEAFREKLKENKINWLSREEVKERKRIGAEVTKAQTTLEKKNNKKEEIKEKMNAKRNAKINKKKKDETDSPSFYGRVSDVESNTKSDVKFNMETDVKTYAETNLEVIIEEGGYNLIKVIKEVNDNYY